MPQAKHSDVALTLVTAAAGGLAFALAGAPAAWLSGSAVAGSLFALASSRTCIPGRLRDCAYLLLGVSMGAGITPEALAGVARWPASIAALLLTIPLIVGSAGLFLVRVMGWEPRSAFLAAAPGALPYVLAVAEEAGLDVARVAIAQSLRLVLMVALLPSILVSSGIATGLRAPAVHAAEPVTILILIGAGLAASLLLVRLRVPSPLLMGGLLASAGLHGSGAVATQLPPAVTIPALIVVGAVIGARLSGTDPAELRRAGAGALLAFLIALGVAAATAGAVGLALSIPLAQTLLAFAPGGIDSSIVMAYALGLEPAFVAAHQLSRFLAIALLVPVVFNALTQEKRP